RARLRAMGPRNAGAWVAVVCATSAVCTFDIRDARPSQPLITEDMTVLDLAVEPPADLAQPPEPEPDLTAPPDLTNPACITIADDFDVEPFDRWSRGVSTIYDAQLKMIELNPPDDGRAGSLFFNVPVHLGVFDARFDFYMGDGQGADGMALVFAKAAKVT